MGAGGTQSIGNLAAIITGDAAQIMGVLNQVQAGMDKLNKNVTDQAPLTEKSATRAGVAMYGLNAIFRAGGSEVMNVINNIQRIPGVPAETIASVQMFSGQLAQMRNSIDGLIAKGVAGFSQFATSLGASLGGMIYGYDNVDEGMKRLQDDLDKAARSTPEYRLEVEKLGNALRAVAEQRAALSASRGQQVLNLRNQSAGEQLASTNFAPEDTQGMQLQLSAAQKLLSADQQLTSMRRELANEVEQSNQLEIKGTEAALSPRQQLADVLAREAVTRQQIAFLELTPDDPRAIDTLITKRKELNAELTQQATLEAKLGELSTEVGKALADGLEKSILAGEGLRETVRGLAQDLERVLVHNLLTQPLADSLSKGASTAISAAENFFAGFFADGGTVPAGQWGIAGENGPEPIYGGASGMTVVPNGATSPQGGGGSTYYIDARGADQTGLAQLAAQIRAVNGSIEYRAVAAVMKYKRGGPSSAFA